MSYSYKIPSNVVNDSALKAYTESKTLFDNGQINEHDFIIRTPQKFDELMVEKMFSGLLMNNKVKYDIIISSACGNVFKVETSGSKYHIIVSFSKDNEFVVKKECLNKVDFIISANIKKVGDVYGCKFEGYIDMLDATFASNDVPSPSNSDKLKVDKSYLKDMSLLFNTLKLKI